MRVIPIVLAAVFLWAPSTLALDVPNNDGFVTDHAQVLTTQQESDLEGVLSLYKQETTNEIAILAIPSLEGEVIADFAVEVGRAWGVGSSENDNGIVIIFSLEDREIFIATGYGLEGAVPDIVAKGVIEEEILPHFRLEDYSTGLLAGVEALKLHIGGEYTAERYDRDQEGSLPWGYLIFFGIAFLEFLIAFLGRTKSWWLGGVLGAAAGLILWLIMSWWFALPALALFGFVFDFIVSKNHASHSSKWKKHGMIYWLGGGRGGKGGGFGGFGGGSFGGGGAGGRW
ncbi:TPM domain-containing protein [Candidatus Peregrinibacteria bacterium]|nr:TPM domain-containing protein [Candidatus Peregrinibacteria bacterium]MBT3599199.1 TPM domain-containing protein [Candidatus Peregrinibacteria bacterium]MBT4367156.1 TPM domain-containing protein [Candidatus Peregrinibacteria bacterium]MBT4585321.1 TPM domain-containing protein [Candidatus Peregrinibacteria bacterium]MBT6731060.1 TPM domain-containing protein [Candidatus Peregrinibacteria bacterium]